LNGMIDNGYDPDFADRCFRQLKGFSEYGFPESHAASFALLVYVSSWLKRHHPAAFAAALINSQPMGFYAPAQIIRDARDHGVEVRPVDVNRSGWDCTLERGAMRLGMRLVKGLKQDDGEAIRDAVLLAGPFDSITALRRASGARVTALRRLANADAFGSLGLDRQHALWTLRAMRDDELPMFEEVAPPPDAPAETTDADRPRLPEIPAPRQVVQDYSAMHLSLKAHPFSFLRSELDAMNVTPARELADERRWTNGRAITVAGLVLVRQRPSTANGIVFMTLEDETGISNLIVRPAIYRRFRKVARHGVAILARGRVERQGEVVHVMVHRLETLDDHMERLAARSRDFH
ncbi:MAG: error-prone DNA polymerase, partial [Planctomycetes bacterium]|nr:error-prone DNA polymerase [Planctomycetota bacterium]